MSDVNAMGPPLQVGSFLTCKIASACKYGPRFPKNISRKYNHSDIGVCIILLDCLECKNCCPIYSECMNLHFSSGCDVQPVGQSPTAADAHSGHT